DDDLLAVQRPLDELRELGLRLVDGERGHGKTKLVRKVDQIKLRGGAALVQVAALVAAAGDDLVAPAQAPQLEAVPATGDAIAGVPASCAARNAPNMRARPSWDSTAVPKIHSPIPLNSMAVKPRCTKPLVTSCHGSGPSASRGVSATWLRTQPGAPRIMY